MPRLHRVLRLASMGLGRYATPFLALVLVLGAFLPRAHAVGLLVPSRGDLAPLSIRYHRVSVSVRERIAETRVEQTFVNQTGETLEAWYVFPVPEGATVSGFAMWVNGVRQEGEMLEAGRAREIYEGIVARMRDPGLVESLGGNLFRARVFPIAPYGEQRIEITFTQTLDYDAGLVHYRYPLRTPGSVATTLADCTISLDIASRTPIRAIYSPTHTIAVGRNGENQATASFEAAGVALDSDFDLYFGVADGDVGLSLLTHRPPGEDGYFLAMVAPRTEVTESELVGKDVLFVIDTSGSMAGDKIERARAALDYMLQRLRPSDTFQVVRFSTDVELLFDHGHSEPASAENVARARTFARHFVAAGGTAIHPALSEALRQRRPSSTASGPRMVVFLTDGMPTVGVTEPARIVRDVTAAAGGARLFVFGLGDDVNTTFLDQLARSNGGIGDYFRDGSELERRMSSFFDRVAYPVFVDLHLTLPGVNAYDVYPRELGDLYRGDQILVVGRYRGDGPGRIVLEGRLGHEATSREMGFDVTFPQQERRNEFLPRVWAVRKVGTLLDDIRLNGERPELRDEVIDVARRFGIVTPYTSYLVVEDDARMAIPATPTPDVFLRIEASASGPSTGSSTGSSGRPTTPSAPPPSAPPEERYDFSGYDEAVAAAPSAGGASASAPSGGGGESGRRISSSLRDMRDAEREDEASEADARWALGRAFRWQGGGWVDSTYVAGMREFSVRSMSPAYFAILSARPELREALALGERVVVVLEGDRALIVSPDAPESSAADARRFVE